MLNEFFTNHGEVVFVGILLSLVMLLIISTSRRKSRKERPDPPSIYAPIRGMYVCYQCDTIFNTPRCPECNEEAVVPLIHLTGSLIKNERITTVIEKMQGRTTWKLPIFQTFQDVEAVTPGPEVINGGASEVPVTIAVLSSERGPELS